MGEKTSTKSLVGDFEWADVLIPNNVGKGTAKWHYQRRTLIQYAFMASVGLYGFYSSLSPQIRAASLGLLFPGAGLIAVLSIPSIISFIISTALIPLVLFAWFGAGGLLFPIALWVGTDALAALLAGDTLFNLAAPICGALSMSGILYITIQTYSANRAASAKRVERNQYLEQAVIENQKMGTKPVPGSRELSLETLRFVQWFIELGLAPKDDFSYHDVIDQFQTSAIRYQLYETVSDLGSYQFIYAPNFHGYLAQAMRNTIEKSLTSRIVGFWKWETLWGKFNAFNFDPIIKDNIMVSGYILQAVGIYQSNTGDDRYTKSGSMVFEVDKSHKYVYDFRSIADTIYRQWNENSYCLFSCEPNWIYTMCNLVGMSGMVLADRLLGLNHSASLKKRFQAALEEEFTTQDGSILPIRSELTGFTIPGLAGKLSDAVNANLCVASLPHIAHRNWAFTKKESMEWRSDGTIELLDLVGADKLDPGNYKPGLGAIRALFAATAAEFGDEAVCKEMLRQLDQEHHPVFKTKTGALKNKGLSTLEQGTALRGRMGSFQDWVQMIVHGPPESVRKGPVLTGIPFPEILVAKAYSQDGEGLDMVLYPGKDAGIFQLHFERLQPGRVYEMSGNTAIASKTGEAMFEASIEGRTALKLSAQPRS